MGGDVTAREVTTGCWWSSVYHQQQELLIWETVFSRQGISGVLSPFIFACLVQILVAEQYSTRYKISCIAFRVIVVIIIESQL